MPLLSRFEKSSELPSSISAAVLSQKFDKETQKVMQNKFINSFFITLLFPFFIQSASLNVELMEQKWPFNGIFGRFDNTALQRVSKCIEVCSGCHGIRHVSYRDLRILAFQVMKQNQLLVVRLQMVLMMKEKYQREALQRQVCGTL